jgi:hypothetical protein
MISTRIGDAHGYQEALLVCGLSQDDAAYIVTAVRTELHPELPGRLGRRAGYRILSYWAQCKYFHIDTGQVGLIPSPAAF